MTERRWVFKIPLKALRKHAPGRITRAEIELIEKLLNIKKELKERGYRHGIYNLYCAIVPEEGEAICFVTTYGDLPWLQRELPEIEPGLEVKEAICPIRVDEKKLKELKEFLREVYGE